ncbi:cytochrome P450 734A5-like isoform X1 [Phragmites australis]|uniref:cytochrome P450 734A5-like isoform X1 n=1 Tax=Phragmites australis TaxID=29695 RepID=UPI002D76AE63|nr:cytochrome P450 734A5-like isoform X1 [Phragmites australis]
MWWPWQWSALAAAAACFCLHVAAARLMEALWWRPRRLERHFARHGVHGPGYRFFVGSSIELIRLMVDASSRPAPPEAPHDVLPRVLAFYHHWRKLYGPKFLIWFGSTPRLTISEPELIREVLLSRAEHFDRYEAPPLVCQFEGYGLTNLHGDEWARRRKTLAPAFHTENLKRLVPFVGETVQRMLEERVLEAAGGGEVEVDVTEWYPRLPQEAITLATFGRNFDEGSVVFRLLDEHASYATEAHTKVFIPGYRFLPTRRNRRVWKLDRGIRRLLARFVAGMQSRGGDRQGERREDGGGVRDFMSFMAPAMTADKIIEECKNIFFAGKETLTNLLTWATVALAMHPEWQDRARWEVLAVCGRRGLPTKDHLPKLKTVPWDDRERDVEAVPAGGSDNPEDEAGRGARRVRGAGGHGDPDPDHGRAPRHQRVGRRRNGVQPRAVRGLRGGQQPAAAPHGVHAVWRRRAGVHRAEPGADGGQGRAGRRAAAVRVPAVAGVRTRAPGAHDTQSAARRAGHLPAVVTHGYPTYQLRNPIGFH